ncbi:unnamed protein product [Triticum turgidum subsp. durum]|uniref:KIB1-4 beta-propeller domain-containing protein n=2 Tax=Triticum turgidum subsp. durum TaxID=4567 RepID=A0A9R0TTF4_TRITD|nr:unnamed protein product [Triticum turgidum subsp. durum]
MSMARLGDNRKRGSCCMLPAGSCKRRATSIPTSGWASLPWDIADLISLRLLAEDVTEYIRFRAVCSPWRSSTASPRDATLLDKRFSPRGWVALCDGDGVPVTAACKITFFHTSTGQRLAVRLPELHRQKIVGITDGLIITLDKDSSVVRVLHPFTRVIVELPPLATIFHTEINNFTSLLSAAVCRADTSIAVVAWLTSAEMVICARQGHPSWVVIHRDIMLHNTLPFQGRLYGTIPASGQLVQLYPPNPRGAVVAHVPRELVDIFRSSYFLVESGGRMLLAVQHHRMGYDICAEMEWWRYFTVTLFQVNVHGGDLIPVNSLGDEALFLGKDRCLSISTMNLPCISGNSVYSYVSNKDPVVLHSLGSGSSEHTTMYTKVHYSNKMVRPSVRPFTLPDHLMTYCHNLQWTRGLMLHEYAAVPSYLSDLREKIHAHESDIRFPYIGDVGKKAKTKRVRAVVKKNQPLCA